MKIELIATFLGLLAAGVSAIPAGRDKVCKKWDWDLPVCSHEYCPRKDYSPYKPNGFESDSKWGSGRKCKKHCPENRKKCTDWEYRDPKYYVDFHNEHSCPKVTGSIQYCRQSRKKQCLVVEYKNWKGRNNKPVLGIYSGDDYHRPKYTWELNYNKWCKKYHNKCVVPVEHIRDHTKLCGKKIWVGVDNDACGTPRRYEKRDESDERTDSAPIDESATQDDTTDDHTEDVTAKDDTTDNDTEDVTAKDDTTDDDTAEVEVTGKSYKHKDEKNGDEKDKNKKGHNRVKYISVDVKCRGKKECLKQCCCA
jgi:hypothetical protein